MGNVTIKHICKLAAIFLNEVFNELNQWLTGDHLALGHQIFELSGFKCILLTGFPQQKPSGDVFEVSIVVFVSDKLTLGALARTRPS